MSKAPKADRDAARKAAYERGWTDSLTAYYAVCCQPWEDKYDYVTGWWACADARRKSEENDRLCRVDAEHSSS